MKRTIIIVFVLCFNNFVFAQISEGGLPIYLLDSTLFNMQKNYTPAVQLPYYNNIEQDSIALEYQSASCENCENKYYGKGIYSIVNIIEGGNMVELETGGKLWLMKFESPTAYGLQFYFNNILL